MNLSRRLYDAAMERFSNDKRKAVVYLQEKCRFYAYKADSKRGTPHHQRWREIYKSYSSASFTMGYHLSLDEEQEREPLFHEVNEHEG